MEFHRGLFLPEAELWLDPHGSKPLGFVSHAHADHFARHRRVICSTVTGSLIQARYGLSASRIEGIPFHQSTEINGHRLLVLPAGHIRGSAMLHVTRLEDGATLLYTGDFKTRPSRSSEMVCFQRADTLILETTFALPHFVFPPIHEVEAQVLRFVHAALDDGQVPVLLAYSLGKAQEALALLHAHGIPTALHPTVSAMTHACRETGLTNLPVPISLDQPPPAGHAVITPPNTLNSALLAQIPNRRTAMLSGWAMNPSARYRYRCDSIIPFSDHADHPGLLECVERVHPKRVITVHGYAREFAAELRQRGLDAWSASGRDQLELGVVAPPTPSPPALHHPRPDCQLADFSRLNDHLTKALSQTEKIEALESYFRDLTNPSAGPRALRLATNWLNRQLPPWPTGTFSITPSYLRRSVLRIPGVRKTRYLEIAKRHAEPAAAVQHCLQEISTEPQAVSLAGLADFFLALQKAGNTPTGLDLLADRLFHLHPIEASSVVRLLSDGPQDSLTAKLLEQAICEAFQGDRIVLRRAHVLTQDLGECAELARAGMLDTVRVRPFTHFPPMVASRARNEGSDSDFNHQSDSWIEPLHRGIRVQIHKVGERLTIHSAHGEALETDLPELGNSLRSIPDDFIIDAHLVHPQASRPLTLKRLRKQSVPESKHPDLFSSDLPPSASPIRCIAYDLLWHCQTDYLDQSLERRREVLEGISWPDPIMLSPITRVRPGQHIASVRQQATATGQPTSILKNCQSPYLPATQTKTWIEF